MTVPRLDTTELNIVFAVELIGAHTAEATSCTPHRFHSRVVDWVPSSPIVLGNEGEGTRLVLAIPANALTMRSLHRPQFLKIQGPVLAMRRLLRIVANCA